jgi:hypothetical protein
VTKEGVVVTLAFLVIELAVIIYAWRFGGSSEGAGAVILGSMVAVTYVGRAFHPPLYERVDLLSLTVDLIGLVGFCWLGISSRKLWPLWAASLQLLSTGAHLIRAFEMPVRPLVYYLMKVIPTLGVIVLLIVATWLHHRRQKNNKRTSSPN